MGKLSCNCLNVKIHIKNAELKPCEVSQLDIDPPAHEFFKLKVAEVQLNIEGISNEISLLTRTIQVDDTWSVGRCANCKLWTHASRANSNSLLVNTELKQTPTEIEELKKSSEYSVLYKILIPTQNECYVKDMVAVDFSEYAHLQTGLENLEARCTKFLMEEKAAMTRKIREFESREREAYDAVDGRCRRDKTTLLTVILHTQQQISDDLNAQLSNPATASSTSSSSAKQINPPQNLQSNVQSNPLSNPVSSPGPRKTPTPVKAQVSCPAPAKVVSPGFAGTTGQRSSSTAKVVTPAPSKPRSALTSMLDGDGGHRSSKGDHGKTAKGVGDDMDMLFPEDQGERPFFNSDDEDDLGDTDDVRRKETGPRKDSETDMRGVSMSGRSLGGPGSGSNSIYSSSVPISMQGAHWSMARSRAPTYGGRYDNDNLNEGEELEGPLPPEAMAASMKALASSVHTDGTEIFGDLPRSRFKTDCKKGGF